MQFAIRLIRADNEYVVRSEACDRPFDKTLMVQDDVASRVMKAEGMHGCRTVSE